eukprot:1444668-Rhodomonas_salina.1
MPPTETGPGLGVSEDKLELPHANADPLKGSETRKDLIDMDPGLCQVPSAIFCYHDVALLVSLLRMPRILAACPGSEIEVSPPAKLKS